MLKVKQFFCLHWFDTGPDYEVEYSAGPIVCMEQRTYLATMQRRTCSKCRLSEERRVGEAVCVGWR